MSELDVIGTLRGTDKGSAHVFAWDYLRHYEELFCRFKHSDINLIEIGVDGGASLRTWHWFFEKATLVGIDVNPQCLRFAGDRTVIKIGSQEDPSFLQSVASEYPPMIVIDDGSHIAHHMITSFETLFPQLRPGGIYIFEDMSFHFEDGVGQWKGFKEQQGLAETSMFDYLSRFIRARAANIDSPKNSWGISRYVFEHIDSVVTFGGVIGIRKKAPRNFERDIEIFEREMRGGSDNKINAERYAQYLVKHNLHQERAVALLRSVLKANPNNGPPLTTLFSALTRLARLDEAAEVAEELTRVYPSNQGSWFRLADLQRQRQRPDLELLAVKKLLELAPESVDVRSRLSTLYERSEDLQAALREARKACLISPAQINLANRVRELEGRLSASR